MWTTENFTELKLHSLDQGPVSGGSWSAAILNISHGSLGWYVGWSDRKKSALETRPHYGPFDSRETAETWASFAKLTAGA